MSDGSYPDRSSPKAKSMVQRLLVVSATLSVISTLLTSPVVAFTRTDAQWVYDTDDVAILDYIICLESEFAKTPRSMEIPDALGVAANACVAKLPQSMDQFGSEDILLSIMECGFRPGEASPDMGC